MPIYDYRCGACGRTVEVIHAIGAEGPSSCEVCGGAMRKALSTPAIHFKGSGWAKKDAQSASRKAATREAPSGGSESRDAKPSEGGESTPAAGSSGAEGGSGGTSPKGEAKGSSAPTTSSSRTD